MIDIDEYLRHQKEMFKEFLSFSGDQIESIEQTITPEGTKFVVRMKPPTGPGRDSAKPGTGDRTAEA